MDNMSNSLSSQTGISSRQADNPQPPAITVPPAVPIPPIKSKSLFVRMFTEKPIVPIIAGSCIAVTALGATMIGLAYGLRAGFRGIPINENRMECEMMCIMTLAITVISLVFMTIEWKILKALFRVSSLFSWAMPVGTVLLVPVIAFNFAQAYLLRSIGLDGTDWVAIFENNRLALFVVFCIAPAVSEEILFRGIMQTSLEKISTPVKAMLMTSLLFAVVHLLPLSMPYIFVLSMLFCWIRQKTGSILPAMVLHGLHNYVVVLC